MTYLKSYRTWLRALYLYMILDVLHIEFTFYWVWTTVGVSEHPVIIAGEN